MPTIHIPTPLRPYVDKQESVEVAGRTVREALAKSDGSEANVEDCDIAEESGWMIDEANVEPSTSAAASTAPAARIEITTGA
jgi:hypothetical protein